MTETMNKLVRTRKWQALFRDWVGNTRYGIRCIGARRRGCGPWRAPNMLPIEVTQYLLLAQTPGGIWYCPEFHSLGSLEREATNRIRRADGLRITFEVDEVRQLIQLPCNSLVRKLASELGAKSLYEIYRRLYKVSACGLGVGFAVHQDDKTTWHYCDSLRHLKPLNELFKDATVMACSVSGYVEGWDGECDTHIIESRRGSTATLEQFWHAVDTAEAEAATIWNDTHGCDSCGPENDYGYRSINPECKVCHGEGTII